LGFVRKSLAFGLGYSLSVAVGGFFLAVCAPQRLPKHAALQALGATAHGLRLAHYIFTRDKSGGMPEDYKNAVAAMEGDTSPLGRLKRLPLVASCAGMYALVMAPLVHSLRHPSSDEEPLPWLGVALQWTGLALAAAADWQKHIQKRRKPDRSHARLFSGGRQPPALPGGKARENHAPRQRAPLARVAALFRRGRRPCLVHAPAPGPCCAARLRHGRLA
jgi:steroid 5-alpha reductase family enzyme